MEIKNTKRDKAIFEKILNMSSDGFIVIDEHGYITHINPAYCKFLNRRQEDVVGKYILHVIKNSLLPELLKNKSGEIDSVHKLAVGQAPTADKYVIVTRDAVELDGKVIAAFGQVKFTHHTKELLDKLNQLDYELQYYKEELTRVIEKKYSFENIISVDKNSRCVIELAKKASYNDFNVLLTGETGTGKEVFAHAIHNNSKRKKKPFIRVNCAAIPNELLESELFGFEDGAFTGAKKGGKKGKFELAENGTIFLDEIGDMPMNMQAKLLRVLQEREFERIGGVKPININVRIIAATNQNLEEQIKNKLFRHDLYYRLNVIEVRIPPLRDRAADIPLFVQNFIRELNTLYHTDVKITAAAMEALTKYSWPGNVRELKNIVERAYSAIEVDTIDTCCLPDSILVKSSMVKLLENSGKSLEVLKAEFERQIIIEALEKNHANYCAAAKYLNIHRTTLYKKMDKHGIRRQDLDI